MESHFGFRLFFCALLAAVGVAAAPARAAQAGPRILIIGDSHTAGFFGDALDKALRDRFGKDNVDTYAVCGASLRWWQSRYAPQTICHLFRPSTNPDAIRVDERDKEGKIIPGRHAEPPALSEFLDPPRRPFDMVVIALGTNPDTDIDDLNSTVNYGAELLSRLPAQAACFWVGPPPIGKDESQSRAKAFPARFKDIVKKSGKDCLLLDSAGDSTLFKVLDPHDIKLGHAYGETGTKWGENAANRIIKAISSPTPQPPLSERYINDNPNLLSGYKVIGPGQQNAFYDHNLVSSGSQPLTVPAQPGGSTPRTAAPNAAAKRSIVGTVPQPYGTHPPTAYDAIISNEATLAGLDEKVLRAVIAAKGGFQAKPDRYVGGAYGLMLVSPMAAKTVGLGGANLTDPKTNIQAGAMLLSRLIKQYGDISHALAAYEVGAHAVPVGGDIPNDPQVKYFLAAFELAYRGGPQKPPVIPVVPPKHPFVQQETQALKEKAGLLKKAIEYKVRGLPWSVARYVAIVIPEAQAAKPVPGDPELALSIMFAESGGDPVTPSSKGAQGLMQLLPGTAKDLKVKLTDPLDPTEEDNRENIRGGIKHLNGLLDHFSSADRDQQYVLAVVAYNAGKNSKAIKNVLDHQVPSHAIESYARKVLTMYNKIIDPGEKPVDYEKYLPVPEATARHPRPVMPPTK